MSYQIGIDTINLRPTPRLAHTEYCSNEAIVRRIGGGPVDDPQVQRKFAEWFETDFVWTVNDGPVNWGAQGRVTDMGHAEFLEGGRDRRDTIYCPFRTVEEVWAFDAVEEYGLPSHKELVAYYKGCYKDARKNPDVVFPGGYYKTIVSGAIQAFGWDMLLTAAADRRKFEKVLDGIYRFSLAHYKAQAEADIEAFICHDDMVWSQGAFMHPDFYRSVIFPRYKELWRPVREAGIKLLFCSDGQFTEFFEDLAEAGADGFIFEPMTSLEKCVRLFGKTHCIVSSKVDARTLTFGTKDDVRREADATLELAFDCPGFIFAVGNHIPSNIPVENIEFYIEYLKANWKRP
jgi:hypothetical protein